jgi:cysteine desulfurase/selenocysteine lyase
MDQHLDYQGLPSEEELQLLANTYFTEPPTEGFGFSPQQIADEQVVSSHAQQVSRGTGFETVNSVNPAGSLPFKNLEYGNLPQSVAGSGASPSVAENVNTFNIDDPQTSLLDPHFEDGKISRSVSGTGLSPSVNKKESKATNTAFESELSKVLNEIISFIPASQLPPGGNSAITEPSFYFLESFNYLREDNLGGITRPSTLLKPPFDINKVKSDFPILQTKVNGKEIVWLDNAATTQKPKLVIDRINYFYENENSNIHRAAHELAARATDAYEAARAKVQHFLNARSVNEIVFVRGTTEAINLVASSWGDQYLNPGDEIIISHLEHHANIVPWQLLAKKKGLSIKVIPVDDDGQIILDEYAKLLNAKTKLVSFTQVSNALGTITPAKVMVEMAHRAGAKALVDGAQSVSHMRTDVQALDADFFVFSGHKVFGPTGIGVLYGKEEILNKMQPYQGGGNMIKDVTFEHTEFHQAPSRFEAGTGNIADAVGLGAAIDYVSKIGMELIGVYEHALLQYGMASLKTVPGIRLIGTAHEKASVMSFTLKGFTNDEVGQALNKEGIAVRTGHHCAQPILRRFGVESTVRPSLAFYNTCGDVDRLVSTLHWLVKSKG